MINIDSTLGTRMQQQLAELELQRTAWEPLWRDVANFLFPSRYVYLETERQRASTTRNNYILDSTATRAIRVLAAGMLNGVTSPARPWLRLRVPGFREEEISREWRLWIEDTVRRLHLIFAQTNFYTAMSTFYIDLGSFGSASMLIYEDDESVFRCFNTPVGEFYFGLDASGMVGFKARELPMTLYQIVQLFGEENLLPATRAQWSSGGGAVHKTHTVYHYILPNDGKLGVADVYPFVELYWEKGGLQQNKLLRRAGYYERPNVSTRWEVTGNDAYGRSPGIEALGDIKQLQLLTKRKAQVIDKVANPPMQADVSLRNQKVSLLPGGMTFVSGTSQIGVKPIYQPQGGIADITADLIDLRSRISLTAHNDLFRMVSDLPTVRSATEIDALREEKLIQLGPVLERFENEALDTAVKRVFGIASRAGLIAPPPEGLNPATLQIQYVSILSEAQRAIGVAPTERFLATLGNSTAVWPELRNLLDAEQTFRGYADSIGVDARNLRSPREYGRILEQQAQEQAVAQAAEVGAPAAKTLSETEVGGGANMLEILMNGG